MDKEKMKLPGVNSDDFVLSGRDVESIAKDIKQRLEWRMDPPSDILHKLKDHVLTDLLALNSKARAESLRLEAKKMSLDAEAKLTEANLHEQAADILKKNL